MLKKLQMELKNAMKEKNVIQKSELQIILSNIKNESINKKRELTNDEIMKIIQKEVKQLNESLSFAEKSGKEDYVKECKDKINFVNVFLPKQLSEEELTEKLSIIIEEIKKEKGTIGGKEKGLIIKKAMSDMGTQTTGQAINIVLNKLLK
jgi:hypothetical protein